MKDIKQIKLSYGQVNFQTALIYLVVLSTGLVIGFANGVNNKADLSDIRLVRINNGTINNLKINSPII